MKLFKVTLVSGSNKRSLRIRAKNANLAYGYAKQFGMPSKVEPVNSRWWHLIWLVVIGLGYYAGLQL